MFILRRLAHPLRHSNPEKVKITKQTQLKGENTMLPILRNHGLCRVRPGETFGSLTRLLDDFLPRLGGAVFGAF